MIPLSTTTITVKRPAPSDDPYFEPGAPQVIASGVRAHISTSRGTENVVGGDQEIVYFRLTADGPVDLDHADAVLDEGTGLVYDVEWARWRRGLGLEHVEAGLRQVEGVESSPGGGF